MKKQLLLLTFSVLFILKGYSQSFFDINAQIKGVGPSTVIWGDYDNDGDLDCFVTGSDINTAPFSGLYQNNSNSFTLVNNNLTNTPAMSDFANAAFGDYDNDGDLDFILNSTIYNNQNGNFTNINANLLPIWHGSASWGDYDNDNDLDLLITGTTVDPNYYSKIYRNDNGVFIDINAFITGVWLGNGEWGDYDNDGDLDILIAGKVDNNSSSRVTEIYKNNANIFTLETSFEGISEGTAKWGDFDNDNDLDVLLCGNTNINGQEKSHTELYRNDGNSSFVNSNNNFTAMSGSFADFIDYNNDGDLDIMLTGVANSSSKTEIYINNGNGIYNIVSHNFMDLHNGTFDWGDYNGDSKLDLIISGVNNTNGFSFNVKIYTQDSITSITDLSNEAINNSTLYPNPALHQISIETDLSISKVSIIDLTGKIILTNEQQTNPVNVSDLTKGIYFITITTDKNVITKKFVKQ